MFPATRPWKLTLSVGFCVNRQIAAKPFGSKTVAFHAAGLEPQHLYAVHAWSLLYGAPDLRSTMIATSGFDAKRQDRQRPALHQQNDAEYERNGERRRAWRTQQQQPD
jgi:hypothetical protein